MNPVGADAETEPLISPQCVKDWVGFYVLKGSGSSTTATFVNHVTPYVSYMIHKFQRPLNWKYLLVSMLKELINASPNNCTDDHFKRCLTQIHPKNVTLKTSLLLFFLDTYFKSLPLFRAQRSFRSCCYFSTWERLALSGVVQITMWIWGFYLTLLAACVCTDAMRPSWVQEYFLDINTVGSGSCGGNDIQRDSSIYFYNTTMSVGIYSISLQCPFGFTAAQRT